MFRGSRAALVRASLSAGWSSGLKQTSHSKQLAWLISLRVKLCNDCENLAWSNSLNSTKETLCITLVYCYSLCCRYNNRELTRENNNLWIQINFSTVLWLWSYNWSLRTLPHHWKHEVTHLAARGAPVLFSSLFSFRWITLRTFRKLTV